MILLILLIKTWLCFFFLLILKYGYLRLLLKFHPSPMMLSMSKQGETSTSRDFNTVPLTGFALYLEKFWTQFLLCEHKNPIIKGYCMSSRINCGMTKSLAQARASQARACEGLLVSDLAIPQLILEQVQ